MTEREKLIELLKAGGKLAVEENHKYIREFVKNHGRYSSKTDNNVPFDAIVADYLLTNGVTVLPCKVGDILYSIWEDDESVFQISEEKVIDVSEKMIWVNGGGFSVNNIGKSDFFSREEAEKEIERRKAQNGLAYATPNFELLEG